MGFVNLNEIYLSNNGGTINGDVEVEGSLIINDGSGEGETLDVADEITELKNELDSISQNPWVNLSVTLNTSNVPSSSVVYVKYFPLLKFCMFRMYIPSRSSLVYEQGTSYALCTIPEGYRPGGRWALACRSGGSQAAQASVTSDGTVDIIARTGNMAAGSLIYIAGCWVVNG